MKKVKVKVYNYRNQKVNIMVCPTSGIFTGVYFEYMYHSYNIVDLENQLRDAITKQLFKNGNRK